MQRAVVEPVAPREREHGIGAGGPEAGIGGQAQRFGFHERIL
jgi:hypothetical protein